MRGFAEGYHLLSGDDGCAGLGAAYAEFPEDEEESFTISKAR